MTYELAERFRRPEKWRNGIVLNARGKPQHYGCLLPEHTPRAYILFVQGNGNFDEGMYEMGREFVAAGCGFYDPDRYGQARSERYLHDHFKLHSAGLDRDIDDLVHFTKTVIPKDAPVLLFGHSGGALIALLAHQKNPGLWQGLSLSAPPLGLKGLLRGYETIFSHIPLPRRLKEEYASGNGPWLRNDPRSPHKAEDFSSDPERMRLHEYWQSWDRQLQIGGVTYGMVQALCHGIAETRRSGALEKIKGLKAVFAAGQDVHVDSETIPPAAARMKDTTFHYFDKAKHSLPWEVDKYRDVVIGETIRIAHKL